MRSWSWFIGCPGPITPPLGSPTIELFEIGGVPVPADPNCSLGDGAAIPDVDVTTSAVTVVIRTTNVPLDAAVYEAALQAAIASSKPRHRLIKEAQVDMQKSYS